MALEKLGRSAEALEDCQAVQRTKPDDESLLSHLYLVYRSLDRRTRVLAVPLWRESD